MIYSLVKILKKIIAKRPDNAIEKTVISLCGFKKYVAKNLISNNGANRFFVASFIMLKVNLFRKDFNWWHRGIKGLNFIVRYHTNSLLRIELWKQCESLS